MAVYVRTWWEAAVLGTGVVATLVSFTRWAAGVRITLTAKSITIVNDGASKHRRPDSAAWPPSNNASPPTAVS